MMSKQALSTENKVEWFSDPMTYYVAFFSYDGKFVSGESCKGKEAALETAVLRMEKEGGKIAGYILPPQKALVIKTFGEEEYAKAIIELNKGF